jgi:hypothetical protein
LTDRPKSFRARLERLPIHRRGVKRLNRFRAERIMDRVRVVFTGWLVFIALGLAAMIAIALTGR